MGDIRFTSGELLNLLGQARSVTSSSVESGHPLANAIDGLAGKPVIFAGGLTESIEADLAPDLYGDFEGWTGAVPNGWTADHSGTGAGDEDTVNFYAGAASAKLEAGASGVAQYYIDREMPSGQEVHLTGQLRITAGAGSVRVGLQCLQTRRWLNTAGIWQDSETGYFRSTVTASWDAKALTASIEAYSVTGVDKVTIRQVIKSSDDCTANVDALHIVPTWDVVSIHGHNADASQAVAVYGGDTAPASNLVATGTQPPARPAFFVRASARQTYRFIKILFPAENVVQLHAGEVVLWQSRTVSKGWTAAPCTRTPYQTRSMTRAGRQSGVQEGRATRAYELTLMPTTNAEDAQLFGEMIARTEDGLRALVLIPDDSETAVIYGRVPAEPHLSTPRAATTIKDYTIKVVEDGLPTVGL